MVSVQKLNEIIMIYSLKDLLYLPFDNASDHGTICSHQLITSYYLSIIDMFGGVFALLILSSMYCRLICPVRSPTNILQCFLSNLHMN